MTNLEELSNVSSTGGSKATVLELKMANIYGVVSTAGIFLGEHYRIYGAGVRNLLLALNTGCLGVADIALLLEYHTLSRREKKQAQISSQKTVQNR